MQCEKCQFECDQQDAFCRKCGSALAHEAVFNETGNSEVFIPPAPLTSIDLILATPFPGIHSKGISRAVEALKGEQGRKLARAAALLAVGIGIEIAAQAFTKLAQGQNEMGKAVVPYPANSFFPEGNSPVIIESVTYQRIFSRSIIKRIK